MFSIQWHCKLEFGANPFFLISLMASKHTDCLKITVCMHIARYANFKLILSASY